MGLLGCRVSALRRVLGRGVSKISGPGRGTGLRAWGGVPTPGFGFRAVAGCGILGEACGYLEAHG